MILKLSSKNAGNNILLTRSLIRKPYLKIEQEKIITSFMRGLILLKVKENYRKDLIFPYLIAVVTNIWGMWIPLKYQEKIKYYDNCLYICYLLKMSYKVPIN